ncbi:TonB-dependent receptor [Sphingobium xanthum]|uniref:TonB-dependent receptor n=2 Tax=Sphingobium TaxID=165695 RepID=UPI0017E8CADB|nr:TonB-dependent receptor [Sphingobium xanthum]MCW2362353.1 iron complex outermembrane receptor protein [Sphingobium sp. B10D3B]MCW2400968.1 iron complex outermembrane receptor protein [Sphingobium sp. B10D7B]MCW2407947.1 iron complex outermembrane receptor protein [Sphingobium xanthum]
MSDRLGKTYGYFMAGAAMAALMTSAGFAQEAPADSASAHDGDEIVITASKVDVSLQRANLSVSAVTAETLSMANVTDVTGLNGSVPGLVVAKSGGAERIITIRGIGSETPENTNTQPGVSYHVDGVYIFNSIAANAAFIDVAQVEVLRGPQGTTFGQGSTGGTINVVSRQPVLGESSANGEIGIGNYNMLKMNAGVNVPLGDTLALRVAGQHQKHDGYAVATDVVGFGQYELDDANETGWKAALLWEPTDSISVSLNTIQYRSNTHGTAQKNVFDPEPDPRRLTQDYPGRSVVNTELYYGVVAFDAGFATVKSITSYQKVHSEQSWDADGLTADLFEALTYSPLTFGGTRYDHVAMWESNTKSWTQEFNISSTHEGPFQWIAGAVYLQSTNDQYILEYRGSDDNLVPPVLPVTTPYNDPLVDNLTYAELSSIKREAWAAYVQGTYDFSSQLSLTAGIRYNSDKYSGQGASNSDTASYTSGAFLQPTPTDGLSTTEWTGKVALDFKITPENLLYASFTRGFKPGGINSSAAGGNSSSSLGFATGIQPTYKPETVNSFEIGSKNRFFNNALTFNASAFYYDYSNMQFLDEDAILYGEGTANAPGAHIYGLELEGAWAVTSKLKIDGSASFLRGKFDEDYLALDPVKADEAQTAAGYPDWLFWSNFYPAVLAREAARENINGNRVPKLPKFQGSIAVTYTDQLGAGELTARAQYLYRGQFFYRVFNDDFYDKTPSYDTVNLFVKYALDDAPVYFSASVTNVFDTTGVNSRFSDPYGSSQGFETYIAPRQAIFSVGFNF